METHYEKDVKEQIIKQYQPEASIHSAYSSEMSQQEKENLFKEIYSNIWLFEKLVYKARKTPNKTD